MAMASQSPLPLSSYNPADVFVLVGGQLFRAHRCILATNSGYFKSLLDADVGHASLSLPGLPSRAFSVLLDFMYSGHLATTGANIYEVLLCAQFLHMPRAIDQCKDYLVQQQQQQELSVNPEAPSNAGSLHWLTMSPLAYKAWLADSIYTRCLDSVSLLQPPTNILRPIPTKRVIAPMIPAYHKEVQRPCATSSQPFVIESCTNGLPVTRLDTHTKPIADLPSFIWRRPDFSPAPVTTNEIPKKIQKRDDDEELNTKEDAESQPAAAKATHQLIALAAATVTATSNVVIDIACCDGPVQFQRVVNENYGLVCAVESSPTLKQPLDEESTDLINGSPVTEHKKNTEGTTSVTSLADNSISNVGHTTDSKSPQQPCDHNEKHLNKSSFNLSTSLQPNKDAANEESLVSTSTKTPLNVPPPAFCQGQSSSEGSGWTDSDNDTREQDASNVQVNELEGLVKTSGNAKIPLNSAYHCVYCNHTFKSRYCYQKHKQRHINPKAFVGPATTPKRKEPPAPLDMNVPFYPCKICGSKFPSYYFVHKHRKMCHCDERLWTDESTTSSNVPEKE